MTQEELTKYLTKFLQTVTDAVIEFMHDVDAVRIEELFADKEVKTDA